MKEKISRSSSPIRTVVLDFDGTCTQIPQSFKAYLNHYGRAFVKEYKHLSEHDIDPSTGKEFGPLTEEHWLVALEEVRNNSPQAGWMAGGCPAGPAAADPYILVDESAKYIFRRRWQNFSPRSFHEEAYSSFPSPWREEALEVFTELAEFGVKIFIVSNSSSAMIQRRLDELFAQQPQLRSYLFVQSDAGKFRICEPQWDRLTSLSTGSRKAFAALPAATELLPDETLRPVYLRRGAYLEAIDAVLNGRIDLISETVFCGDIWEMDLAMPYALGAKVHLIDRAFPFNTYEYERRAIESCGASGRSSRDLRGLLDWVQ